MNLRKDHYQIIQTDRLPAFGGAIIGWTALNLPLAGSEMNVRVCECGFGCACASVLLIGVGGQCLTRVWGIRWAR